MNTKALTLGLLAALWFTPAHAVEEMVIGDERIEPGLRVIFEGAVKDSIHPPAMHLKESETDVHIEARINWDEKDLPKGTPAAGFVPYLHVTAEVTSEETGHKTEVELLPHLNLVDNFHYARNMKLPGVRSELYTVTFHIKPPKDGELHYHHDWVSTYGTSLFKEKSYTYRGQNFNDIANASRR